MTSHEYARLILEMPEVAIGDTIGLATEEVMMLTLGVHGDMVNAATAERDALLRVFIEPETQDPEDMEDGEEFVHTGRWRAMDLDRLEDVHCRVFETRAEAIANILDHARSIIVTHAEVG